MDKILVFVRRHCMLTSMYIKIIQIIYMEFLQCNTNFIDTTDDYEQVNNVKEMFEDTKG